MAQVTVAMPARNVARFIGEAIASVRRQSDVDWELIVVDDASTDDTAAVVLGYDDPRIRLLHNPTQRGIGYCHNRVVAESSAPYVAQVDSDDFIMPGALRKMITALEYNPNAGQAYCQFYDIDQDGRILREAFLTRIRMFQRRARGIDYRRDLVVVGTVINALRTYPRHVLNEIGAFNAALSFGEDYEYALRIADRYEFAFVPEFLYVRRLHPNNNTETLSLKRWRFLWQRYKICRTLERSQQVLYFKQKQYNLKRLLLTSFKETLFGSSVPVFVRDQILPLPRAVRQTCVDKIAIPALNRMYEFAVDHGGWWRAEWWPRPPGTAPLRLAYYLWRFPSVSDTFIRREVQGMLDAGLTVKVFADIPGDLGASPLGESTRYLKPLVLEHLASAKRYFKRHRRLQYANILAYVLLHRYGRYKTWREDEYVFERIVMLAYELRENGITHLHAPWADRTAFIALAAAALLGIPYTVQARAHDLHRTASQYALREKFSNARFVITNSDYNARAIESYLDTRRLPLHMIRNLLPLADFGLMDKPPSDVFRILCVARLIEEKGLVYLLGACARLRDRGIAFYCEIIGGTEEPTYINYLLQLRRLHRRLELDECVVFRGAQPFATVHDAYTRADLFVLPCVIAANGGRDISPNSLIEAMAMQLPVISTRVSAIPEIVEHGVSGILVPPNDEGALADAIETLMQDEPRRKELGRNARARVEAKYDAHKSAKSFVSLFRTGSLEREL